MITSQPFSASDGASRDQVQRGRFSFSSVEFLARDALIKKLAEWLFALVAASWRLVESTRPRCGPVRTKVDAAPSASRQHARFLDALIGDTFAAHCASFQGSCSWNSDRS